MEHGFNEIYKEVMVEYAPTSHNRTVYASPPVGGSGSVHLGQSLYSFPRFTPPTFLQALACKTSHTAGMLCAAMP
jgi:hypothetical protein